MRFRDLDGVRRLGREAVQEAVESGALAAVGVGVSAGSA
jgi:hypothetical protein